MISEKEGVNESVYERSRKNIFRSIKNFWRGRLSKLNSRGFRVTIVHLWVFFSLYNITPYSIKEKLLDLIERAFKKFYKNEGTLYLACIVAKYSPDVDLYA